MTYPQICATPGCWFRINRGYVKRETYCLACRLDREQPLARRGRPPGPPKPLPVWTPRALTVKSLKRKMRGQRPAVPYADQTMLMCENGHEHIVGNMQIDLVRNTPCHLCAAVISETGQAVTRSGAAA